MRTLPYSKMTSVTIDKKSHCNKVIPKGFDTFEGPTLSSWQALKTGPHQVVPSQTALTTVAAAVS